MTNMLIIAGIVFNAGGISWLAMNHFTTVVRRLDHIDAAIASCDRRLARLEGAQEERRA